LPCVPFLCLVQRLPADTCVYVLFVFFSLLCVVHEHLPADRPVPLFGCSLLSFFDLPFLGPFFYYFPPFFYGGSDCFFRPRRAPHFLFAVSFLPRAFALLFFGVDFLAHAPEIVSLFGKWAVHPARLPVSRSSAFSSRFPRRFRLPPDNPGWHQYFSKHPITTLGPCTSPFAPAEVDSLGPPFLPFRHPTQPMGPGRLFSLPGDAPLCPNLSPKIPSFLTRFFFHGLFL